MRLAAPTGDEVQGPQRATPARLGACACMPGLLVYGAMCRRACCQASVAHTHPETRAERPAEQRACLELLLALTTEANSRTATPLGIPWCGVT